GRFQERVIRIKSIVAEIFIKSAVKLVRAAARDRLHAAAATAPEGRVVERGLDFEFLYSFRRGHSYRCRAVESQLVGVNAVDLEIVLRAARAVDRDGLRVATQSRVVGEVGERAWRERENLQEVARSERQLRNCARVNNAAQLRAFGLNERPRCDADYLFADRSHFEADINCGCFSDSHLDRSDLSSLESIRRNAHAITAWRNQRDGVSAFRVGCDFALFGG